ncbi:hypothetical protein B6V73_19115 [Thioclava sp. JM3]|nr:hypothetical protein B6V73_19115 [Thioclava sp. JM3]
MPDVSRRSLRSCKHKSSNKSARQRSLLDGLLRGRTHKEIAKMLGISQFTVRTYQERLMEKFGVASRAELIVCVSGGHLPKD